VGFLAHISQNARFTPTPLNFVGQGNILGLYTFLATIKFLLKISIKLKVLLLKYPIRQNKRFFIENNPLKK